MPLPTIKTVAQKTVGGLKSIKERLSTPTPASPAETPAQSNTPPTPTRNVPTQRAANNPISRVSNTARNRPAVPDAGAIAFSRNQEANDRAIERSRAGYNPLIPLIQNVNITLVRNR